MPTAHLQPLPEVFSGFSAEAASFLPCALLGHWTQAAELWTATAFLLSLSLGPGMVTGLCSGHQLKWPSGGEGQGTTSWSCTQAPCTESPPRNTMRALSQCCLMSPAWVKDNADG